LHDSTSISNYYCDSKTVSSIANILDDANRVMVLLRLKNINEKKKSNQHSTLVIGIGIVLTILILIITTIILTYHMRWKS